jgi:TPR repeat protein
MAMVAIRVFIWGMTLAVAVVLGARAQTPAALAGMQAYNRGDIGTAYRLLRQAADAGDPEALVNLGYLYARGQGIKEDQSEAYRLYLRSAELGDSEGMNAVGYKYLFGTGIPRNPERAVYWFCMAIAKGNPRAMNNLALVINDGQVVARDEAEARSLWEQSARLGHANSMLNLGKSYLLGMERDETKGSEWIGRAAQGGQPEAQALLRANGYRGPLPPPFFEAATMIPAPKNAAGHAKICGAAIS